MSPLSQKLSELRPPHIVEINLVSPHFLVWQFVLQQKLSILEDDQATFDLISCLN